MMANVNELRELQSQSQEKLDALLPSVLDRAFKGELQDGNHCCNCSIPCADYTCNSV